MAYLQVGDWEVDPAVNELRRNGEAIRLEPKAIEVLRYLAERPGEVVGREALLSAIWPGVRQKRSARAANSSGSNATPSTAR